MCAIEDIYTNHSLREREREREREMTPLQFSCFYINFIYDDIVQNKIEIKHDVFVENR